MSDLIFYEHPLNELIRVCLRLECLFRQTQHYIKEDNYFDSRAAIQSLIEVINVLDRPDFKSKLTTELIHFKEVIQQLEKKANVNTEKSQAMIETLSKHITYLETTFGKFGQSLRANEFLTSIRYSLARPGGGWSFDVPLYHHWLQKTGKERQTDLQAWFNDVIEIKYIIEYMLNIIRDWHTDETQLAESGFCQINLDPKLPYQLLQLWIPEKYQVIPEVSVGKHRMTVRFLKVNFEQRPQQVETTIEFKLKLCVL